MSSTLLTPDMILREAGRIFHQYARFINSIDRQYDDAFARTGAKIGDSLRLRRANQYLVSDGPTMVVQDTVEESDTLTINKHKHVAVHFGMQELALSLDDFSERVLLPAMSGLAATVDADALSNMTKDVYSIVDGDAAAFDFVHLSEARRLLNENLAPPSQRTCLLSPAHESKYLTATKGLFNPQTSISRQYREGVLGNILDFDMMSSTLVADHTTGSAPKTTTYLTDIAGGEPNGSNGLLHIDTGSATFKKGDIITIADTKRVHPETKADTGQLQQFVVTADFAGGEGDLAISPKVITSGARQNVTGIADGKAITKVGAGANELLNGSLAFHKEAFVFATADLPDPSEFGAWGARKTIDGIRFSIAKQFDILNYRIPCRIDIIYGYKTRYPQLAARIHADG